MFIELLMAATLNLSLPEFQPEKDISGNYIELSTDVSNGEVVVDELTQEEFDSSVSDHLPVLDTQPADPTREVIYETRTLSTSNNDIVSAIQDLNTDNSNYWELFLDSYTVENHYSAVGVKLNNPTFKFSSSGQLQEIGNSTISVSYIPVMNNVTYTFTNFKPSNFNNFFLGVVDDIENPTVLYNFRLTQTYPTEFTVKPDIDGYFIVLMYTNANITFDANWTLIEQESYTLSELGNAVMDINEKQRIILFICLMNFCLPFLINGLRLMMGGKDYNV